jgi:hypothetical protein
MFLKNFELFFNPSLSSQSTLCLVLPRNARDIGHLSGGLSYVQVIEPSS